MTGRNVADERGSRLRAALTVLAMAAVAGVTGIVTITAGRWTGWHVDGRDVIVSATGLAVIAVSAFAATVLTLFVTDRVGAGWSWGDSFLRQGVASPARLLADERAALSSAPGTRSIVPAIDAVRRRVTVEHVFLATIVAIWAMLYVRGLGEHPLRVWDESRYAVPARNMVTSGNWLDPQLQVNTKSTSLDTGVRLVKPPLLYWLQATAMTVFGATEFAARLPSALAALAASGLIYRIGSRTYDRYAGFAGALLFLIFPGILLGSHAGRGAVPDATLAFVGSCFVWLTWRGRRDPRLLVPAGVAAGLAVMTKGIAAGVFVFAVLPLVLGAWRAYYTQWRWTLAGVVSTLVVALPWHLYAWLAHGQAFVEQYFIQAVVARVKGNASVAGRPSSAYEGSSPGSNIEPVFEVMNYPYLRKAAGLLAPPYDYGIPFFVLLLVLALAFVGWLVRRDGRDRHVDKLALLWWTAAVPLTFAVVGGNQPWYVLPMYVPGAVVLGYVPAALLDGTFGTMVADVLERTGLSTDTVGSISPRDRLRAALPDEPSSRARVRTALYLGCCLVVALALVTSYAAPPDNQFDYEQRALGETIAAETPGEEPIYVWFAGDAWRKSLMSVAFYADRPYERVSLDRLRSDEGIRYAIVPVGKVERLDVNHEVVANGTENHVLFVRFPDRAGAAEPDRSSRSSPRETGRFSGRATSIDLPRRASWANI